MTHHLLSPYGSPLDIDEAARFAETFQALSVPHRLRIVSLLARDPWMSQTELFDHIPLSQPAVAHHLRWLQDTGLIERRKVGTYALYRPVPGGFSDLSELLRAGGRTT